MKRLVFLTMATVIFASHYGFAANTIGAGFILGSPSGLTAKIFMLKNDAIDIGIGESSDDLYMYADYLRHFPDIFPVKNLAFYVGAGAGFHDYEKDSRHDHEDENRVEIRTPLGLEYTLSEVPIRIFFELVPALRIAPDVDFGIRGGLGARYFF
jgi:hypothetical protein